MRRWVFRSIARKKGGGGKVGLKIYLERSALAGRPTTWNQNERNCASFFYLIYGKTRRKSKWIPNESEKYILRSPQRTCRKANKL